MKATFKKSNNGHNIYIDSQWIMWVIGSLKTAKKELEIYLRNN